ncbi:predicted protein [Plenodomus lingam JN3]|uniref:Predicted protein n=1 Tax=Leptosphaeria maculans (strain JN3 / isolate v23.1.3 / race Av1-4-5-6-7-8) TaxID=985895 RepID=E5R522_LEPMJ|nr:predicted protein [Plenodomus lingam JN3]CBX91992.1 predicted protein [Plenodomus lingam JN3]
MGTQLPAPSHRSAHTAHLDEELRLFSRLTKIGIRGGKTRSLPSPTCWHGSCSFRADKSQTPDSFLGEVQPISHIVKTIVCIVRGLVQESPKLEHEDIERSTILGLAVASCRATLAAKGTTPKPASRSLRSHMHSDCTRLYNLWQAKAARHLVRC